jgi:hypothetical protein
MEFKRGDAKDILKLGGYSFNTLRKGAILQVKFSFGVTDKTGDLRHISSCTIPCPQKHYLLVTRVEDLYSIKMDKNRSDLFHIIPTHKEIGFITYPESCMDILEGDLRRLERGESFPVWRKAGHIGKISKRQFDNRLRIIKPGLL